jgi:fucose permease
VAFVSLGLPDALLGVAWPSIRDTFGLPFSEIGLLLTAMVIGYLSASFATGPLVARIGVGGLLVASSVCISVAMFGFALAPSWWVMVGLNVLSGMGAGAIDAGLNSYAAAHFSERHVNWLHACYGLGAALGPLLMTTVLATGAVWRWGYALVGGVLLLMTLVFATTRKLWENGGATAEAASQTTPEPREIVSMGMALRRPLVWLGIGWFFLYTGVEVTAGQLSYSLFTEGRDITPETAGIWTGIYWGSLTVGRVVFGILSGRFKAAAVLRLSMFTVPLGALLIWLNITPMLSFFGLALMGFMLAPIFPLLISQTPVRLGAAYANHAIGFQVAAANLGAAIVPGVAGVLATAVGLESIGPYLLGVALLLLLLHQGVPWQARTPQTLSPDNLYNPPGENIG